MLIKQAANVQDHLVYCLMILIVLLESIQIVPLSCQYGNVDDKDINATKSDDDTHHGGDNDTCMEDHCAEKQC